MKRLPEPPYYLENAHYEIWPSEQIIHRIHLTEFDATQFNPGEGTSTRFAPFQNDNGVSVPTLYGGSTLQAALHETIFHDQPDGSIKKTVPIQHLFERTHSTIYAEVDLRLVSLRNPNLGQWSISTNQLINTNSSAYPHTVQWAQAVYRSFKDAHGMIWTSNQCDPDSSMVIFGDRIQSQQLTAKSSRYGNDEGLKEDTRAEGKRRGITLIF